MEDDFFGILTDAAPEPAYIEMLKAMTADIHQEKLKQLRNRHIELERHRKALQQQKDSLMDNLASAPSEGVQKAIMEKIDKIILQEATATEECTMVANQDIDLESAVGTVLDFVSAPQRLWENGTLEDKQLVLRLTFANKLRWNQETGFGTADLSLPFSVMKDLTATNSGMVGAEGFEPPTKAL